MAWSYSGDVILVPPEEKKISVRQSSSLSQDSDFENHSTHNVEPSQYPFKSNKVPTSEGFYWQFYYKYLHGKLPSYFYSFNIVTQGSQHTYNTRQSEQIRTERTRAEYCDNRLRIYLPGLVNSAPLHLLERIATHSIQGFSFGIKYHFLNSYPTECSIVNCYICHRNQR